MTNNNKIIDDLYKLTEVNPHSVMNDPDIAHLTIHHNKVLGTHLVPGLHVDVQSFEDGINAKIRVDKDTIIKNPVHICFGMLPEKGVQKIIMDVHVKENAQVSIIAHCVFPNAVDVKHIMDANIKIDDNARYSYFERHVHGDKGGIKVYPKAKVELGKRSRFKTEFELLKGRVGEIYIDYETTGKEYSVLEMTSRINGTADDIINIKETAYLTGEGARGALNSRIAVRENAKAEVYNKLIASAAHARGHVDCKEIVQGNGIATAVPVVEVNHPKAHVTHEAAIGSVDDKQLQTLMARGLTEDDATDLIIEGLLS